MNSGLRHTEILRLQDSIEGPAHGLTSHHDNDRQSNLLWGLGARTLRRMFTHDPMVGSTRWVHIINALRAVQYMSPP